MGPNPWTAVLVVGKFWTIVWFIGDELFVDKGPIWVPLSFL